MEFENLNSYKKILQHKMDLLKERRGQSVSYQKLAEACGIQKTYLSRLFHDDKTHLSGDQLFLAMNYLNFSPDEVELTETFWNWERAGNFDRKRVLKNKLDQLQKERRKTERIVNAKKIVPSGGDAFHEYYLDPFQQLVHTFLMIPRFQEHPDSIGRKLGITQSRLNVIFKKLVRLGVIKEMGKSYSVIQNRLHLTPDSPVYYPYRALMRLRSLDLMQRRSQEDSYGVSVLFTGTEDSRKRVQNRFLQFLKDVEAEVKDDPSEEVYQMNFDLVSWTDNRSG